MKYFGIELPILVEKGAAFTAKEITQQPDLWKKVYDDIVREQPAIQSFLNIALKDAGRIILTGAGSSAFIGLSLSGIFRTTTNIVTEAIATTDLVSHPKDYFYPDTPTLMISFARSGNSPESTAAVALADELCKSCYHLIITCNADGKLARYASKRKKFVFALPREANDQSLAMTSSYTGMLLSGILIAHLKDLGSAKIMVETICGYGRKVIDYYYKDLKRIAEKDFNRAVFLGAGPLFGAAKESHLKLQEFTDGKIICKEDSFLGFRHGPKAVINDRTLVVYIFSNESYALKYEKDLAKSMKKSSVPMLEIGIMESAMPDVTLDYRAHFSDNGVKVAEEYLAVCSVLPAQIMGFFKSLQLGLRPDTPSSSGAITRVVEGVLIYQLNA